MTRLETALKHYESGLSRMESDELFLLLRNRNELKLTGDDVKDIRWWIRNNERPWCYWHLIGTDKCGHKVYIEHNYVFPQADKETALLAAFRNCWRANTMRFKPFRRNDEWFVYCIVD